MNDDLLQGLLDAYNPHWDDAYRYDLITRERYRARILALLERPEILVLKGIRRSGKSSLLKLTINALRHRGVAPERIWFMNLEDYRLGGEKSLETLDALYGAYRSRHGSEGRRYVLLDEIQEVPGFESWLRTHSDADPGLKFVVTGSSSALFSSELATLLTGRQVSIEVFPFGFGECLSHWDARLTTAVGERGIDSLYLSDLGGEVAPHLDRFLSGGGFPEVVKHADPEANHLLLQQYISDIVLRDIARRHNIRRIEVLQKLALYLIFNMSAGLNITRIAELLGSNRTTILDLIAHLQEVYLVFLTGSFSFQPSERLSSTRARKVYCVDNGLFAAINAASPREDLKKWRNAVFQRLRFQWGETLYYWRDKVEVDFVMEDGFPVGVAESDAAESLDRDIYRLFHFLNAHNRPEGLMISQKKLQIHEEGGRRIVVMPLWLFLLRGRDEVMGYAG